MALVRCPECGREVSDRAESCPGCGYPFRPAGPGPGGRGAGWYPRYEYKSSKTVFGLPLIHIVYGPAWAGGLRPARGFIAIGNVAIGVFAIGGFALGVFTLAGIGLGIFCFAGIALGIALGIGGIATGYIALGGIAVGVYAVGGLAIGSHTIWNDPQLMQSLKKIVRF